jgi:hypothetical protein
MSATFKNAQPGDRVWSIRHGWGTIQTINDHNIFVRFANQNFNCIYTICGKFSPEDLNPSLFWDEVKFDIPQKPIKMKHIHGVEVPDITFKPTPGEYFYHPSIDCVNLHRFMVYTDDEWCKFLSENNLCYPCNKMGREAAIIHTKAMLEQCQPNIT